jgi:hypothetical protein
MARDTAHESCVDFRPTCRTEGVGWMEYQARSKLRPPRTTVVSLLAVSSDALSFHAIPFGRAVT